MKNNTIIITDGCDNDGRVSSLYLKTVYPDADIVYLDRDRTILPKPKWADKEAKGYNTIDPLHFVEKNIYFTDICLDYSIMQEIANVANSLKVFDHHKVDEKTLKANWYAPYSTGETKPSAAMLVANWLDFRGYDIDKQLAFLVSDRDTFEKSTVQSEYVYMSLDCFEDDYIIGVITKNISLINILGRGKHLYNAYQNKLDLLLSKIKIFDWEDKEIAYTDNIESIYISDLGNLACVKLNIDFYVNVNQSDNSYKFSFRSLNGEALMVAKKFNGGGHPNAAGAKLNYNPFVKEKNFKKEL